MAPGAAASLAAVLIGCLTCNAYLQRSSTTKYRLVKVSSASVEGMSIGDGPTARR